MLERAKQITVLKKSQTLYTVLHGMFLIAEIRKKCRQSSIYFLAHLNVFGLPIAEVQAYEGLILTLYDR
jgi:hypothetical protein